jgi:hypothetical protein
MQGLYGAVQVTAMKVERITDNGPIFYCVWSEYAKDTLAFTPKELLHLLVFLQDFEQQLIADTQENRPMEEQYSEEE